MPGESPSVVDCFETTLVHLIQDVELDRPRFGRSSKAINAPLAFTSEPLRRSPLLNSDITDSELAFLAGLNTELNAAGLAG